MQQFSRSYILQSPLSGEKKSASIFLLPKKKKNIWRRGRTLKSQHRLGRPSETRRPGVRLWRPGGYLRFTLGLRWVYVGSTLGLPWVYLRSTLGLPWVISLAISGRFLLIFAESLTKRQGRKSPPNVLFSGEEKCSHFFLPDRGDDRSRQMLNN